MGYPKQMCDKCNAVVMRYTHSHSGCAFYMCRNCNAVKCVTISKGGDNTRCRDCGRLTARRGKMLNRMSYEVCITCELKYRMDFRPGTVVEVPPISSTG